MSVLIKGMNLPTACKDCPMSTFEDFDTMSFCNITLDDICFNDFVTKRLDNCPLVSVPQHGDLMDRDAFLAEQRRLYCEHCKRRFGMWKGKMQYIYDIGDAPCRACGYGDVLDALEDAPAIIEAEGEG